MVTGPLYVNYVDNLLVETRGLLIASGATILTAIVAAIPAKSTSLWLCVLIFIIIALVRLYFMSQHSRNRPSKSIMEARRRENIYIVGAVAHMGMMSMWSLVAFVATDDVFPRFAAFSLTIPYAFGMWTRSYALDRGMNAKWSWRSYR